jgi:hypothetical protein
MPVGMAEQEHSFCDVEHQQASSGAAFDLLFGKFWRHVLNTFRQFCTQSSTGCSS